MDTFGTRFDLSAAVFEAFTAYFSAHNNLNEGYPTIFKDSGLTYGRQTTDLFQRLKDPRFEFEDLDDDKLKLRIIITLRSLAETLRNLKGQLDQAHLEESIKENGWKKVLDGNNDLKDKDTEIRIRIETLEFDVQMLLYSENEFEVK